MVAAADIPLPSYWNAGALTSRGQRGACETSGSQ
jgi:hypothetical protein